MIDPFPRVRLIECDDFDEWTRWITTLHVKWSLLAGKFQNQDTLPIFVIGIILEYFCGLDHLAKLLNQD